MHKLTAVLLVFSLGCKECGDNSGNTYTFSSQISNHYPNLTTADLKAAESVLSKPAEIKLVPVPVPYSVNAEKACP